MPVYRGKSVNISIEILEISYFFKNLFTQGMFIVENLENIEKYKKFK